MFCTVIDIRGDYAFVKYDDTGVVSEVAIALLPFGIDVGDKLKFEKGRLCAPYITPILVENTPAPQRPG